MNGQMVTPSIDILLIGGAGGKKPDFLSLITADIFIKMPSFKIKIRGKIY